MALYDYICTKCSEPCERVSSKYLSMEEDTEQRCNQLVGVDREGKVEFILGPEFRAMFGTIAEIGENGEKSQVVICSGKLVRDGISLTQPPNTEGGYQMAAILSNGQKVPGHFGKSAASKKPRHVGKQLSRKGEYRATREGWS